MDCLLMTAPLRYGYDTCQRIQRVLGVTVTPHSPGLLFETKQALPPRHFVHEDFADGVTSIFESIPHV
jgi:hypothetical protein